MIYLHVPFCESRCTYCGFFSSVILGVAQRSKKNLCLKAYADAVCREVDERREEIANTLSTNTLYIGGGTPSVLPLSILSRIIHSIALPPAGGSPSAGAAFDAPWSEFTIEVNPEDIVEKGEEYVRGLLGLGVNRISMGVQSFDDGILRWMNRRHDSAAAEEAFRILRRCGVRNISIDLIFGLPPLSEALWSETVDRALELGPEHISAYQLSVEEGSTLDRLASQGKFTEATEEQCREQYDMLCARLGKAGYNHYEVSNFAVPGHEAIHNSAYWRRVPYVGLGPGAHSLSAGSVRSWNSEVIPRLSADGALETYSIEKEFLTPEDIRVERIMLSLRTARGISATELRTLAGGQAVDRLLAEGALVRCHPERCPEPVEGRSGGSLRIPEDHFFTSDDIIRSLI